MHRIRDRFNCDASSAEGSWTQLRRACAIDPCVQFGTRRAVSRQLVLPGGHEGHALLEDVLAVADRGFIHDRQSRAERCGNANSAAHRQQVISADARRTEVSPICGLEARAQ